VALEFGERDAKITSGLPVAANPRLVSCPHTIMPSGFRRRTTSVAGQDAVVHSLSVLRESARAQREGSIPPGTTLAGHQAGGHHHREKPNRHIPLKVDRVLPRSLNPRLRQ